MGYTTEFYGGFEFNKPVDPKTEEFINTFAETRHMKRDVEKIKTVYPKWQRDCFNGMLGIDGEYFIGGLEMQAFDCDGTILDYNRPGGHCPSLWCSWIIEDGKLVWDGSEKFYRYADWLRYLIENFFAPQGYVLNGAVRYEGEDSDDYGTITIINNTVRKVPGLQSIIGNG